MRESVCLLQRSLGETEVPRQRVRESREGFQNSS